MSFRLSSRVPVNASGVSTSFENEKSYQFRRDIQLDLNS